MIGMELLILEQFVVVEFVVEFVRLVLVELIFALVVLLALVKMVELTTAKLPFLLGSVLFLTVLLALLFVVVFDEPEPFKVVLLSVALTLSCRHASEVPFLP